MSYACCNVSIWLTLSTFELTNGHDVARVAVFAFEPDPSDPVFYWLESHAIVFFVEFVLDIF